MFPLQFKIATVIINTPHNGMISVSSRKYVLSNWFGYWWQLQKQRYQTPCKYQKMIISGKSGKSKYYQFSKTKVIENFSLLMQCQNYYEYLLNTSCKMRPTLLKTAIRIHWWQIQRWFKIVRNGHSLWYTYSLVQLKIFQNYMAEKP